MDILKKYKWYWRLDPDTEFFCSITYDPFVEMAKRGHVYGFTMAIWEVLSTVPSLFRHTTDYKDAAGIPSSPLWNAMVDPSPLPYPLRRLMSLLGNRDRKGDAWNGCHYWSNFEIGDMDFFRGSQYQAYFEAMDRLGGFYFERVFSVLFFLFFFFLFFFSPLDHAPDTMHSGATPPSTRWPSPCSSTPHRFTTLTTSATATTSSGSAPPMHRAASSPNPRPWATGPGSPRSTAASAAVANAPAT